MIGREDGGGWRAASPRQVDGSVAVDAAVHRGGIVTLPGHSRWRNIAEPWTSWSTDQITIDNHHPIIIKRTLRHTHTHTRTRDKIKGRGKKKVSEEKWGMRGGFPNQKKWRIKAIQVSIDRILGLFFFFHFLLNMTMENFAHSPLLPFFHDMWIRLWSVSRLLLLSPLDDANTHKKDDDNKGREEYDRWGKVQTVVERTKEKERIQLYKVF